MEADTEVTRCVEDGLRNEWLKALLVAGATCITPSFPGVEADLPQNWSQFSQSVSDFPGEILFGEALALSPIDTHLEGLIKRLSTVQSWVDEGVEPPTVACRRYTLDVLRRLASSYGVIPYKITWSKEGGILAAYKNARNDRILRVEVDNDLDVVAVVSDGKAILESGFLEADDLEPAILGCFDPVLAPTAHVPGPPGFASI
jgi:hypothetical protein